MEPQIGSLEDRGPCLYSSESYLRDTSDNSARRSHGIVGVIGNQLLESETRIDQIP